MTVRIPRATLEEYLQWPAEKPYLEFIHGEIRPKPVPDAAHSMVQMRLAVYLVPWADANQGWVMSGQRCILEVDGETEAVLPDVAWWSGSQLPTAPRGSLSVAPFLAVEVLSPDDRYGRVQDKVLFYLRAGVAVVWVVDPRTCNVTVYRQDSVPEVVNRPASLRDDLLPGLVIPLAELFARLPDAEQMPRVQE